MRYTPWIVAAVVFLVMMIRALFSMKRALLRAIPDNIKCVPVTPEEYPDLSREDLRQFTDALTALGFEHVLDYRTVTDVPTMPRGFARLLFHRKHQCFAEINQAFPNKRDPIPMRCMIGSYLSDDWSLSTTNRKPEPVTYMLRRPKTLWCSLPEAAPKELLSEHLSLRHQLADDLGLEVVAGLTQEKYFDQQKQSAAARKQALHRKNILVALYEIRAFRNKPKYEWLGAYARLAARSRIS